MSPSEQRAPTWPAPSRLATSRRCGCGCGYDAAASNALRYVGTLSDDDDDVRGEMRNCVCGSTIAVPLCIVEGCISRASWTAEGSLDCYCETHILEWLRAEESKR